MTTAFSSTQRQHLYQRLGCDEETLWDLCQRWQIQEFALFGSILREDFRPDSDIDVLITFLPDDLWNIFDIIHLKQELETLSDRSVDLTQKHLLCNPYRRAEILKTHYVLYDTNQSNTGLPLGHDQRDRPTANLSTRQNL